MSLTNQRKRRTWLSIGSTGECPVGEVVKVPTRSPAKDWRFNPHCGRSEKDIGTVCKQATWLSTTPKMLGFDPGSFPTGQPVPQALPVFGHEGDTNVARTLREGVRA